MMESTNASSRRRKTKPQQRSGRSTPRQHVASNVVTPRSSSAFPSTTNQNSAFPSTANQNAPRTRSRAENSVSRPVAVTWFQPTLDSQHLSSGVHETESRDAPPVPEIIEAEEATLLIELEPIDPSQNADPAQNADAAQGPFFTASAQDFGLLSTTSEAQLIDSSANPSDYPSRISVSAFPSSADFQGSSSSKKANRKSTGNRKVWPGRYKVKVLEQSPGGKKGHRSRRMDTNSPYRIEDFIDVDGKLKLTGKAFETFVTHQEYQLLRDFYVPGIIASRVTSRVKRSTSKQSNSSVASTSPSRTSTSQPKNLRTKRVGSKTGTSSTEVSKANSKTASSAQDDTIKDDFLKIDDSVNEDFRTIEDSVDEDFLKIHDSVDEDFLTIEDSVDEDFLKIDDDFLARKSTDMEVQTSAPPTVHQESQTRHRPSVEFDLDKNSVEDFQRDSDADIPDNDSNQSLTSAMGVSADASAWGVSADPSVMDSLPENFYIDLDDDPQEVLWDRKVSSAVHMIAAILAAQKAGTESLESPMLLGAVELLGSDQLQQVIDLVKSSTEHNGDKESLLHLMETYSAAYGSILGHIRASDAYDSQFTNYVPNDLDPDFPEIDLKSSAVDLSTSESAGDTAEGQGSPKVEQSAVAVQELQLTETSAGQANFPSHYLRYSSELSPNQLKVKLGATSAHLFQEIHLHDMSLRMTYGVNGVSTILTATRLQDDLDPISTGNLLLMHNQHASLVTSRLITSKYFFNRLLLQLMTLGELFLVGKYSKLDKEATATISPKKYHALRQISVFSSILLPMCNSFVVATRMIHDCIRELVKSTPLPDSASTLYIGQPQKHKGQEVTVPIASVLPAAAAHGSLLKAFAEIDSIIATGSTSLRALNTTEGVKVPPKYYKALVTFLEGVKQLERGRDLDFGALLIGYAVDLALLNLLEAQNDQKSLETKQRLHLFKTFQQLSILIQELNKLAKKATLMSSFASSRSMTNLRKFRFALKNNNGCFHGILKPFQKRKPTESEQVEEKEAILDLQLERSVLEQDKSRLLELLRAISQESSVSLSIF